MILATTGSARRHRQRRGRRLPHRHAVHRDRPPTGRPGPALGGRRHRQHRQAQRLRRLLVRPADLPRLRPRARHRADALGARVRAALHDPRGVRGLRPSPASRRARRRGRRLRSSATPPVAPPQHSPASSTGSSRDRRPEQGRRPTQATSGRRRPTPATRSDEAEGDEAAAPPETAEEGAPPTCEDRHEDKPAAKKASAKKASGEEGRADDRPSGRHDHDRARRPRRRRSRSRSATPQGHLEPRPARGAFAAGAARASGERRRRSGTPLIPTAPVEVSAARRLATGADPDAAADDVIEAAVTEGPTEPETRPTTTTGQAPRRHDDTARASTEPVERVETAEPVAPVPHDEPVDVSERRRPRRHPARRADAAAHPAQPRLDAFDAPGGRRRAGASARRPARRGGTPTRRAARGGAGHPAYASCRRRAAGSTR